MAEKNLPPVPGPVKNSDAISSDEQTDLKIHQHLTDVNDEISDQDIKNVRTDVFEDTTEEAGSNDLSGENGNDSIDEDGNEHAKETKEKVEEQNSVPIITPWSILGS